MFKDSILASAYVDYIYGLMQPASGAAANNWSLAANGGAFNQLTEEQAGEKQLEQGMGCHHLHPGNGASLFRNTGKQQCGQQYLDSG